MADRGSASAAVGAVGNLRTFAERHIADAAKQSGLSEEDVLHGRSQRHVAIRRALVRRLVAEGMFPAEVAHVIGWSRQTVYNAVPPTRRHRRWTSEERAELATLVDADMPLAVAATTLGRSIKAVIGEKHRQQPPLPRVAGAIVTHSRAS